VDRSPDDVTPYVEVLAHSNHRDPAYETVLLKLLSE